MKQTTAREKAFILRQRVARLATVDEAGAPHVVPVCYAYDGDNLFSALDHKPKRVPVMQLQRIRNIKKNPHVSLVIDEYCEDWSRLGYVLVRGEARIISDGVSYRDALLLLTQKYPQYQQAALATLDLPVIEIVPTSLISWGKV